MQKPTYYVPPAPPPPLLPPKMLDSSTFDFESTALIRPPFQEPKNKLDGHKFTRVVIDSRDRNRALFPNPSKYEVELDTDIQDVVTGEVVIKDIPLSTYVINRYNNTLLFNGSPVFVPEGNWTATTFAPILSNALGGAGVFYDASTDKYDFISGTGADFTISFALDDEFNDAAESDLALILGFAPGSTNASTGGRLTAPYCVNFAANRYCVLRIGHFTINNSANPVLHKSTALIGQQDVDGLRSLSQPIKKHFNPIIARLTKLSISFTDYYGNPYDFHNKDHRLEIVFESKKILTKYSAFV